MVGLMQAAGLDAHPVALSTHDNGMIYKEYPFYHYLNDVAAMATIDGNVYFADATTPLTRYDELPERSVNTEGLIIKKKEPEWTFLAQNTEATDSWTINMKILPDEGKLNATANRISAGYAATDLRSTYNGDVENLKERYKGYEGMTITNLETANFEETVRPFIVQMEYDVRLGEAGEAPEKIMFNPLLYIAPGSSPFRQAERTHPVNLIFSAIDSYTVEVEIPDGYTVEHLPEALSRSNDVMQVVYQPVSDGRTIKITAGYAMRDFYTAEEYPTLKTTYEEMLKVFSDVIILTKE
jgi:hypothetical protein